MSPHVSPLKKGTRGHPGSTWPRVRAVTTDERQTWPWRVMDWEKDPAKRSQLPKRLQNPKIPAETWLSFRSLKKLGWAEPTYFKRDFPLSLPPLSCWSSGRRRITFPTAQKTARDGFWILGAPSPGGLGQIHLSRLHRDLTRPKSTWKNHTEDQWNHWQHRKGKHCPGADEGGS